MRKELGIFYWLFLVAALALVISGFYLFLREAQEESLFYLNMVASCCVVIALYSGPADLFGRIKDVSTSSSGYGIRWVGIFVYSVLALLLIIMSIWREWGVTYCLMGHGVLLLGLLMTIYLSLVTVSTVREASERVEDRKSGLTEIKQQLSQLKVECKMNGADDLVDMVEQLSSEVRFIAPTDDKMAKDLEQRLISTISLVTSMVGGVGGRRGEIMSRFDECRKLIDLRKKQC